MGIEEYLDNIKGMIDDLKAMTSGLGLNNTGDEYKIISELFTYKFLNDKLVQEYEQRSDKNKSFSEFIEFADADTARISEEYLLANLFQRQNEKEFPALFDQAFVEISELNKDIYSIETTTGAKKPLLEKISLFLRDEDKEAELAKRSINILNEYTFKGIYSKGWDYFSSIFEYLIKDYNKDSGAYGEYYTPVAAGMIMAKILYNNTPVEKVSLYDPAAGSGTLLLSMANVIGTRNCTLYSQDRSQKSTQFLRVNLILNNLAHSLANVIEGNTMTNPANEKDGKLEKYDIIVSNPPFNSDFSSDITTMQSDKSGRFFAGIPAIPKKDKGGMALYQCFLQHILASLADNGKAAVVVPSGFTTDTGAIPTAIRQKIIDENWLSGVVHIPGNIFANTNTSVSLIFIDKTRAADNQDIILVDATHLGETVKINDKNKTILSTADTNLIVNTFLQKQERVEFSKKVNRQEIIENGYLIKAGLYFEMNYPALTDWKFNPPDEFKKLQNRINGISRMRCEVLRRNELIRRFVEFDGVNDDNKYETELGLIPNGWKPVSVEELLEVTVGGEWGKETPEGRYTEPIHCIRGTDIPNVITGVYDDIPVRYVQPKHIREKAVKANDIIIEISGGSPIQSTGRVCYMSEDVINEIGGNILCTNFCRILRFQDARLSLLVYDLIKLLYDRKYLFNLENNTTGIKNLIFSSFEKNIRIALPENDMTIIDDYNKFADEVMAKEGVI